MNLFGTKLRALRKARMLTQQTLAQMLYVDKTYICAIETGKKNVSRSDRFIRRLGDKLNLTATEIADLTECATLSAHKTVIPAVASEAERRLIRKLLANIGQLNTSQIVAMDHVLNLK